MRVFLSAFLFLFIMGSSSCRMAHLDKYPGTRLDSIPQEFRGAYYLKVKPSSHDPDDSISINVVKTGWSYKEGGKEQAYTLSDNTVFSRVDDYYVISARDESLKQYWNSWVIINKSKKMELYPIVSIGHNHAADRLSRYLRKGSVMSEAAKDSVYFYEVTDKGFVKYFEKEIKGSKTFEIIHIKNKK